MRKKYETHTRFAVASISACYIILLGESDPLVYIKTLTDISSKLTASIMIPSICLKKQRIPLPWLPKLPLVLFYSII